MKTQELKIAIEEKVAKIKELKKFLGQNHNQYSISAVSTAMYNLRTAKTEVRAMYMVYGWYRGKHPSQIEKNPSLGNLSGYFILNTIFEGNKDHYELFKNWMLA